MRKLILFLNMSAAGLLIFLLLAPPAYAWSLKGLWEKIRGSADQEQPKNIQKSQPPTAKKRKSVLSPEKEKLLKKYPGTWKREGIYVGKKFNPAQDATFVFTENTFQLETGGCKVSGALEVTDDTMILRLGESSCPEKRPEKVTGFQYEILQNGNLFVATREVMGTTIRENYRRFK